MPVDPEPSITRAEPSPEQATRPPRRRTGRGAGAAGAGAGSAGSAGAGGAGAGSAGAGDAGAGDAEAATAPVADPAPADGDEPDRNLRGLVGAGSSQVGVSAALRARDAARPGPADLAAAAARLHIVRRGWVPPPGS
jgi:hypothetical protein